ncbi:hypothetical protein RFI_10889 [Reticulomyxa filosa]|uniref:Uncharacterized protein n=1 Tax=Reticulomyxa filosa TaxID=46433 RepID=X6NJT8_RETFI|nr:hypothetical protein RFI_10889 [Reticulomyxa filosa]|eukprot:ETO26246.1 hypothetical protein RFI_10889 [Reticulomyxa filosa]
MKNKLNKYRSKTHKLFSSVTRVQIEVYILNNQSNPLKSVIAPIRCGIPCPFLLLQFVGVCKLYFGVFIAIIILKSAASRKSVRVSHFKVLFGGGTTHVCSKERGEKRWKHNIIYFYKNEKIKTKKVKFRVVEWEKPILFELISLKKVSGLEIFQIILTVLFFTTQSLESYFAFQRDQLVSPLLTCRCGSKLMETATAETESEQVTEREVVRISSGCPCCISSSGMQSGRRAWRIKYCGCGSKEKRESLQMTRIKIERQTSIVVG